MGGVKKWNYGTGTAEGSCEDQFGIFTIRGVVTPRTVVDCFKDNGVWLKGQGLIGQVVRYDSSCMAIDADGLLRSASSIVETSTSLATPTALVVSPEQFELFSTYVALMSKAGIFRSVHLRFEQALDWTRRVGPIHAEMLSEEMREPPLSSPTARRAPFASSGRLQAVLAVTQRRAPKG